MTYWLRRAMGYCWSCGGWLWFHTETCIYWDMKARRGEDGGVHAGDAAG